MTKTSPASPIKPTQVLALDPSNQLKFHGRVGEVITCPLRLTNPTDRRVCFKVKTNAPHQYCVQPSGALIEPHQTVTVNVLLQPVCEADKAECRTHKFMVQSIFAPEGELNGLEKVWQQTKPEDVMDSKLTCFFEQINEPMPVHYTNGHAADRSVTDSRDSSIALHRETTVVTSRGLPLIVWAILLAVVAFIAYKLLK